jgi:RES domain-containing protein
VTVESEGARPRELDARTDDEGDARFAGLAFRQCHPDHAGIAETVRASAALPSRFTPPGARFGVLYAALAPETAAAELRRRAAQLGVPVSALAPRVMLTIAVRLRRVLDLTDPAVRAAWGLTREDLASDDCARCQEAATVAREDGYEAIRYPSPWSSRTSWPEARRQRPTHRWRTTWPSSRTVCIPARTCASCGAR